MAAAKKTSGSKLFGTIPLGDVIYDKMGKEKWRVGPLLGSSGCDETYLACEYDSPPKKGETYPFVVKFELYYKDPSLSPEIYFYMLNGMETDEYIKAKKLTSLGMPVCFERGTHVYKRHKFRYLILERYGKSVRDLFVENGEILPTHTAISLGLQMLDVLEYVHSKGYVHGDINGSNILMGLKEGTKDQAYLVNYKLALRVDDKDFKPNRRRLHYGTIEYTSRDAHLGAPTMRGDLEMVGYNMLKWLEGSLSWGKTKKPKAVQIIKEAFMADPRLGITNLPTVAPEALIKFFEYINTLKPEDSIDYAKCRQILQKYLKSQGVRSKSKPKVTVSEKDRLDRGFSPITFDAEPSRDKKVKPKRKLQSAQEVSVQRVVTKKATDVEPKASTSRETDRRRN